jgi:hypothetical protein
MGTVVGYNVIAVTIYSATSSLVRFENYKNIVGLDPGMKLYTLVQNFDLWLFVLFLGCL